jgi:peptidoglycan/xylan/chitin deacetylase (PgdA/CDA1 family)
MAERRSASRMTPRRVPGRKAVRQAVRWMRVRRQPHITILGYHRVSDALPDPFDLAVTPAELDAQLGFLAREARPVSLAQAVNELASGEIPPRTVVLTFDDGYEDTLTAALPALRRHGVPATVFVTTGNPGKPFWWDAFAADVLGCERLPARITIKAARVRHELSTRERGRFLLRAVALLQAIDQPHREEILSYLREQCGHGEPIVPARALFPEEIARLAADELIEIGAHTVTHPPLAGLSRARQRAEIVDNQRALASAVGAPVRFFSYPHGSFTPATVGIVREAGFSAACCSVSDVATSASAALELPRLWVDGPRKRRFRSWIRRWLGA